MDSIPVGESVEITVEASPRKSASPGLASFIFWANSTDSGEANLQLPIMRFFWKYHDLEMTLVVVLVA